MEIARTQKEFSRAELSQLLATTPPAPFTCPVGEVWPAFTAGAPHTERTVRTMLDMFRAERSVWKQYHLLTALNQEEHPSLAVFWTERLADPQLPKEHRSPVTIGLWKTGSDEDRKKLLGRLGADRFWDMTVLTAIYYRPEPLARPAVASRFRDRKAPAQTRTFALQVLMLIGGPEARAYLREAAADPNPEVRKTAAQLAQEHGR